MTYNKTFKSSIKDDWGTPQDFYDALNAVFSFDVDLCADENNTKCPIYYSEQNSALDKDWTAHNCCWMNPPYGHKTRKFMQKALAEYQRGASIVTLVAGRPDTRVMQDICFPHARAVCFVRGRLQFIGANDPALFPSALAVFTRQPLTPVQIYTLAQVGRLVKAIC
jgi:site-specific DNA-methyltransferase (adenine-specific)